MVGCLLGCRTLRERSRRRIRPVRDRCAFFFQRYGHCARRRRNGLASCKTLGSAHQRPDIVIESAVVSCVLGVSGPAGQQAFRSLGTRSLRLRGAWASSSPLPSKAKRRWPPRAPLPACPRSRWNTGTTETAGTVGSSVQRTRVDAMKRTAVSPVVPAQRSAARPWS